MYQATTNKLISISRYGIGALLCLNLLACSSDTTVHEVEEPLEQIPMQFSQAAVDAPLTRATTTRADDTSKPLKQGFLVSCFKGSSKQTVMDRYEVKYKTNPWENSSQWGYVGKKGDTEAEFWQDQIQRYWDISAFPYQFYAISPCPAHDAIKKFTISSEQLIIPAPFSYQTCTNGTPATVTEPYYVAEATYHQAERVALPFRHIMSKVRFGIYSTKQLASSNFNLSDLKVKVVSGDFIIAAAGYSATTSDIFNGTFTEPTTAATDTEKLLLQTGDSNIDMSGATVKEKAYFAGSDAGLLQIPQADVQLKISFKINGTQYDDITIAIKDGEKSTDSFTWEPNKFYTYYINISELSPLTIEFSAQLSPWTDVVGAIIDTNLEK